MRKGLWLRERQQLWVSRLGSGRIRTHGIPRGTDAIASMIKRIRRIKTIFHYYVAAG